MSVDLEDYIAEIKDWPQKGVVFKDITPLLHNPIAFKQSIADIKHAIKNIKADYVASIEARGFIFGAPLALELGLGFIPIRKPGKLPRATRTSTHKKEYGEDKLCIHEDAIPKGSKIILLDDILATGGTISNAAKLIEELGGEVVSIIFFIELGYLNARTKLSKYNVTSIINCMTPLRVLNNSAAQGNFDKKV